MESVTSCKSGIQQVRRDTTPSGKISIVEQRYTVTSIVRFTLVRVLTLVQPGFACSVNAPYTQIVTNPHPLWWIETRFGTESELNPD